ncbi:MAG: glycine cleavage system aminomethyltransferase GcvT [Chlorobiota bacterium]|nr:glycine cleavage system aminomethyltransferase GcvT [Chlorobiota bacterium]QQS65703.1 MAG: glycine cleavage system aminomethyltransferase GcvT [Chlorobiota bacterium]
MSDKLKRTSLFDIHEKLGAKIVPFAGFEMPVSYKGIISEHLAVRNNAGLFDVSHMGEVSVTGESALEFIQKITINDASVLINGQAQYSAMCLKNGGIIDDLLVYKRDENNYLLVINASNIDKDFNWMLENKIDGVELTNVSDEYSLLALQGPKSLEILQQLTETNLSKIEYYYFVEGYINGVKAIISRTGYTGELGFELYISSNKFDCESVWNSIMEKGSVYGIEPTGLGARDTLRLEMGYCLYGNDVDETTNPIEAGLGWITKINKNDFNGKSVIVETKMEGPKRKLVAIELLERAIPRHGYEVSKDGKIIGVITSGTMSPSLNKGIAMGYVETQYSKAGTELNVLIRGNESMGIVVKTPFLKK